MRKGTSALCVIVAVLSLLCPAAAYAMEQEKAPAPAFFNSAMAFEVFAFTEEEGLRSHVGSTPSDHPLEIPPCKWWYVRPGNAEQLEKVVEEVKAKSIPGLGLPFGTKDDSLVHLKGLTALRVLDLHCTDVTDAGLVNLEGLTGLQTLDLSTDVTDAGLVNLKGLTGLQTLELRATKVTDAGLVHLKGLTGLRTLYLMGTNVTDAGVAALRKSLPNADIIR